MCLTPVVEDTEAERDAKADEREVKLGRREKALDDRLDKATAIAAAAEQRDAVSDARDLRSENREDALDRARASSERFSFDANAPGRHAAAHDRTHAKSDRLAAEEDRAALTEDAEDPEDPASR